MAVCTFDVGSQPAIKPKEEEEEEEERSHYAALQQDEWNGDKKEACLVVAIHVTQGITSTDNSFSKLASSKKVFSSALSIFKEAAFTIQKPFHRNIWRLFFEHKRKKHR